MADSRFSSRIKLIFDSHDARSEHNMKMLKNLDDLSSIILKGHLIIEDLITTAIAAYCGNVDQLEEARLRFGQRVSMLRALERISVAPPGFWVAIQKLNSLRNEMAHNLDVKRIPKLSAALVQSVQNSTIHHNFPKPSESREALIQALYFLIGGLEVVSLFHQGIEQFVENEITKK